MSIVTGDLESSPIW